MPESSPQRHAVDAPHYAPTLVSNDFLKDATEIDGPTRRGALDASSVIQHIPTDAFTTLQSTWGGRRLNSTAFVALMRPVVQAAGFFDDKGARRVDLWVRQGWISTAQLRTNHQSSSQALTGSSPPSKNGSPAEAALIGIDLTASPSSAVVQKLGFGSGVIVPPPITVVSSSNRGRVGGAVGATSGSSGHDSASALKTESSGSGAQGGAAGAGGGGSGVGVSVPDIEQYLRDVHTVVGDGEALSWEEFTNFLAAGVAGLDPRTGAERPHDSMDKTSHGTELDAVKYAFRGELGVPSLPPDETSKEWFQTTRHIASMDALMCVSRRSVRYLSLSPPVMKEGGGQTRPAEVTLNVGRAKISCADFIDKLQCTVVCTFERDIRIWQHVSGPGGGVRKLQTRAVPYQQSLPTAVCWGHNSLWIGTNAGHIYPLQMKETAPNAPYIIDFAGGLRQQAEGANAPVRPALRKKDSQRKQDEKPQTQDPPKKAPTKAKGKQPVRTRKQTVPDNAHAAAPHAKKRLQQKRDGCDSSDDEASHHDASDSESDGDRHRHDDDDDDNDEERREKERTDVAPKPTVEKAAGESDGAGSVHSSNEASQPARRKQRVSLGIEGLVHHRPAHLAHLLSAPTKAQPSTSAPRVFSGDYLSSPPQSFGFFSGGLGGRSAQSFNTKAETEISVASFGLGSAYRSSVKVPRPCSDVITSFCTTPHSTTIVATSLDATIAVFDAAVCAGAHTDTSGDVITASKFTVSRGHLHGVLCCGYSDTIGVYLTGGFDSRVLVWGSGAWREPAFSLTDPGDPVSNVVGIKALPGTPYVATADSNGTVKLWDLRKRACVSTLEMTEEANVNSGLLRRDHIRRNQESGQLCSSLEFTGPRHRQLVLGGARLFQFGLATESRVNPTLAHDATMDTVACQGRHGSLLTVASSEYVLWDAVTGSPHLRRSGLTPSKITSATVVGDHVPDALQEFNEQLQDPTASLLSTSKTKHDGVRGQLNKPTSSVSPSRRGTMGVSPRWNAGHEISGGGKGQSSDGATGAASARKRRDTTTSKRAESIIGFGSGPPLSQVLSVIAPDNVDPAPSHDTDQKQTDDHKASADGRSTSKAEARATVQRGGQAPTHQMTKHRAALPTAAPAVVQPDVKDANDVILLGHDDGSISIHVIDTGAKMRVLRGHQAPVSHILPRFHADPDTLVSVSSDGHVCFWAVPLLEEDVTRSGVRPHKLKRRLATMALGKSASERGNGSRGASPAKPAKTSSASKQRKRVDDRQSNNSGQNPKQSKTTGTDGVIAGIGVPLVKPTRARDQSLVIDPRRVSTAADAVIATGLKPPAPKRQKDEPSKSRLPRTSAQSTGPTGTHNNIPHQSKAGMPEIKKAGAGAEAEDSPATKAKFHIVEASKANPLTCQGPELQVGRVDAESGTDHDSDTASSVDAVDDVVRAFEEDRTFFATTELYKRKRKSLIAASFNVDDETATADAKENRDWSVPGEGRKPLQVSPTNAPTSPHADSQLSSPLHRSDSKGRRASFITEGRKLSKRSKPRRQTAQEYFASLANNGDGGTSTTNGGGDTTSPSGAQNSSFTRTSGTSPLQLGSGSPSFSLPGQDDDEPVDPTLPVLDEKLQRRRSLRRASSMRALSQPQSTRSAAGAANSVGNGGNGPLSRSISQVQETKTDATPTYMPSPVESSVTSLAASPSGAQGAAMLTLPPVALVRNPLPLSGELEPTGNEQNADVPAAAVKPKRDVTFGVQSMTDSGESHSDEEEEEEEGEEDEDVEYLHVNQGDFEERSVAPRQRFVLDARAVDVRFDNGRDQRTLIIVTTQAVELWGRDTPALHFWVRRARFPVPTGTSAAAAPLFKCIQLQVPLKVMPHLQPAQDPEYRRLSLQIAEGQEQSSARTNPRLRTGTKRASGEDDDTPAKVHPMVPPFRRNTFAKLASGRVHAELEESPRQTSRSPHATFRGDEKEEPSSPHDAALKTANESRSPSPRPGGKGPSPRVHTPLVSNRPVAGQGSIFGPSSSRDLITDRNSARRSDAMLSHRSDDGPRSSRTTTFMRGTKTEAHDAVATGRRASCLLPAGTAEALSIRLAVLDGEGQILLWTLEDHVTPGRPLAPALQKSVVVCPNAPAVRRVTTRKDLERPVTDDDGTTVSPAVHALVQLPDRPELLYTGDDHGRVVVWLIRSATRGDLAPPKEPLEVYAVAQPHAADVPVSQLRACGPTTPATCIVSIAANNHVAILSWEGNLMAKLEQGPLANRQWALPNVPVAWRLFKARMRWLRLRQQFVTSGQAFVRPLAMATSSDGDDSVGDGAAHRTTAIKDAQSTTHMNTSSVDKIKGSCIPHGTNTHQPKKKSVTRALWLARNRAFSVVSLSPPEGDDGGGAGHATTDAGPNTSAADAKDDVGNDDFGTPEDSSTVYPDSQAQVGKAGRMDVRGKRTTDSQRQRVHDHASDTVGGIARTKGGKVRAVLPKHAPVTVAELSQPAFSTEPSGVHVFHGDDDAVGQEHGSIEKGQSPLTNAAVPKLTTSNDGATGNDIRDFQSPNPRDAPIESSDIARVVSSKKQAAHVTRRAAALLKTVVPVHGGDDDDEDHSPERVDSWNPGRLHRGTELSKRKGTGADIDDIDDLREFLEDEAKKDVQAKARREARRKQDRVTAVKAAQRAGLTVHDESESQAIERKTGAISGADTATSMTRGRRSGAKALVAPTTTTKHGAFEGRSDRGLVATTPTAASTSQPSLKSALDRHTAQKSEETPLSDHRPAPFDPSQFHLDHHVIRPGPSVGPTGDDESHVIPPPAVEPVLILPSIRSIRSPRKDDRSPKMGERSPTTAVKPSLRPAAILTHAGPGLDPHAHAVIADAERQARAYSVSPTAGHRQASARKHGWDQNGRNQRSAVDDHHRQQQNSSESDGPHGHPALGSHVKKTVGGAHRTTPRAVEKNNNGDQALHNVPSVGQLYHGLVEGDGKTRVGRSTMDPSLVPTAAGRATEVWVATSPRRQRPMPSPRRDSLNNDQPRGLSTGDLVPNASEGRELTSSRLVAANAGAPNATPNAEEFVVVDHKFEDHQHYAEKAERAALIQLAATPRLPTPVVIAAGSQRLPALQLQSPHTRGPPLHHGTTSSVGGLHQSSQGDPAHGYDGKSVGHAGSRAPRNRNRNQAIGSGDGEGVTVVTAGPKHGAEVRALLEPWRPGQQDMVGRDATSTSSLVRGDRRDRQSSSVLGSTAPPSYGTVPPRGMGMINRGRGRGGGGGGGRGGQRRAASLPPLSGAPAELSNKPSVAKVVVAQPALIRGD